MDSTFVFQPGTPKYLQVADDLRRRIRIGDLQVGDSLGDLFKAADHYRCSWGTVRTGQDKLVGEGLLSPIRAGVPTRVIARPSSSAMPEVLPRLHALKRDLDALITELERP